MPLALTDASPRAPQVCNTSREDKRTGFTVPPQTTRDVWGILVHPRERERDWERECGVKEGSFHNSVDGFLMGRLPGISQIRTFLKVYGAELRLLMKKKNTPVNASGTEHALGHEIHVPVLRKPPGSEHRRL